MIKTSKSDGYNNYTSNFCLTEVVHLDLVAWQPWFVRTQITFELTPEEKDALVWNCQFRASTHIKNRQTHREQTEVLTFDSSATHRTQPHDRRHDDQPTKVTTDTRKWLSRRQQHKDVWYLRMLASSFIHLRMLWYVTGINGLGCICWKWQWRDLRLWLKFTIC